MLSNVNNVLGDQHSDNRAKDYVRELTRDLGAAKSELSALTANDQRVRRQLDEMTSEMDKMEKYAVKSLEYGKEDEARMFLSKKADIGVKVELLQLQNKDKKEQIVQLTQIYEKLANDIHEVVSRISNLNAKSSLAKTKETISKLDEIEDDVIRAIYEAEALVELRKGTTDGDSIDDYFNSSGVIKADFPEDELSLLKKRLNKE